MSEIDTVDSAIEFVRECKLQSVDVLAALRLADEVEQLQAEVHWLEKVEMKVLQKEIERQRTVIKTLETSDWFAERARSNSLQFEVERLNEEFGWLRVDYESQSLEVDHLRTLVVHYETEKVETEMSEESEESEETLSTTVRLLADITKEGEGRVTLKFEPAFLYEIANALEHLEDTLTWEECIDRGE